MYYGLHIDDLFVAIGNGSYNKSLEKAIEKFAPNIVDNKDKLSMLKKDIKHSYFVCKANPEEYFLMGLADCDDAKRKSFVTDKFMYMTMGKYVSRKKHDTECDDMAVWNGSSVNTVRFLSFNNKKTGFHTLKPFLRTGRKGAVVDNAGSGGVFANVDVETGCLSTCGIDEKGRRYECHPDSGIRFEGWQIPRYDELVSTVKEMHLTVMPDHPYIGWDMALTDDGWVVIECNWGQLINQYADHIGLKSEFMEYLTGK